MKSRCAVIIGVMAMICFLSAGVTVSLAQGDGKIGQKEWSKIIESKVAEQAGDKAIINYEDGYVEALGTGAVDPARVKGTNARPMCLRAAQVDGYRNLLEATKGVQIDSQTTVRDFITESDVINAAVSGLVKGAKVINKDYLSDGTCEVTLRMSLSGKFAQTIIPKAIQEEQKRQPTPPAAPQPAPAVPQPTAASAPVYTGMVVDARGLGARPAMSPKVVDETGAEVYGSMIVDKAFAVSQGISGYARDLTAAQGNQRVTNNPVTVKGVSAEGAGKADIKISNAEAQQIRAATENLSFMKKCRVMIVLD
ncbi:MAG: hypothetical protein NTZ57_04220 [Deltaproteobacteria bacterium]|nr:hypothetical protein [Deltaproteobacteria bacterium]